MVNFRRTLLFAMVPPWLVHSVASDLPAMRRIKTFLSLPKSLSDRGHSNTFVTALGFHDAIFCVSWGRSRQQKSWGDVGFGDFAFNDLQSSDGTARTGPSKKVWNPQVHSREPRTDGRRSA